MRRRALLAGLLVPSVLRAQPVGRRGYGPSPAAVKNWLRNSVASGAVAGTPGTMPTNWAVGTQPSGLTSQVVGSGTQGGIPYLDVRWSGTAGSSGTCYVRPDGIMAAAPGQTWTMSCYVALAAGSVIAGSGAATLFEIATATQSTQVGFTPTGGLVRQTVTRAFTQPDSTGALMQIGVNIVSGATVDFTIRVGAPQLERSPVANAWVPTSGTAASSGPGPIGYAGG